MVKQIIENKNYIGTDKYSQIMDDEIFKTANEKRVQKPTSVCVNSEDLQEIRSRTYCLECGLGISRIDGNCRCEKWDCRNPDCYELEYQLTDRIIIGSVLIVMNTAIVNSNLLVLSDCRCDS